MAAALKRLTMSTASSLEWPVAVTVTTSLFLSSVISSTSASCFAEIGGCMCAPTSSKRPGDCSMTTRVWAPRALGR